MNPNGKTPFGRTPLFAAMSRDNDHVMELLLSHKAALETRDVDGATAVEVARRLAAKQCIRKVRHLQLQGRGADGAASQGSAPGQERRRRLGPRVIRIPSGAAVHREPSCSSASACASNGRPPTVKVPGRESPDGGGWAPSRGGQGEARGRPGGGPGEARGARHGPSHPVPLLAPRPARLPQGRDGDLYTWDDHPSRVGRAPGTAGTQVRIPAAPSSSGGGGRGSRATRGSAISWSDTTSVGSAATPRMLPFRPTVYDLTTQGPGSLLSAPSASTSTSTRTPTPSPATPTPSAVTVRRLDREDAGRSALGRRSGRPFSLVKYCSTQLPPARDAASRGNSHRTAQEPPSSHGPAQEPPGRPPSRLESTLTTQWESEADQQQQDGWSVSEGCALGSQEALSVISAPELPATRRGGEGEGEGELGPGLTAVGDQGESDDDGGRVVTSSRGKGLRSSDRAR